MSVAFYMDEHIHRAITSGLRLRGIDVLTVQEDGYGGYSDLQEENSESELLKVALENILEALGETRLKSHEIQLQKDKINELLNQFSLILQLSRVID